MKNFCILILFFAFSCSQTTKKHDFSLIVGKTPVGFEEEINQFIKEDQKQFPPDSAVLFVGSSSIRLWKSLPEDMQGMTLVQRGFGGSNMKALNYYTDRIVIPYNPKTIVVYEGDNDLASGIAPDTIFKEYQVFTQKVHAALPNTKIFFLAIKPCASRRSLIKLQDETNQLIENYSQHLDFLGFLDIRKTMYKEDGTLMTDIFESDSLHLNRKGYEEWTKYIKHIILKNGKHNN